MTRPLLGFSLTFTAISMWAMLPFAVQQVLPIMSAPTLVWYRFCVAAVGLLLLLTFAKKCPKFTACTPRTAAILLLGVGGLSANFVLFSEALHYISPTTNQVLWQLAPFTMMLCGVWLFKERFGTHQKIGLILLIGGLIAFFNDRFGEILQLGNYSLGILLGAGASTIWVTYAIAQKLLLAQFTSQQILLMIYFGCAVALSPAAEFSQLTELSGLSLACFIFCCANTLIGYGAYGEALKHWDATKISVITTLLPILTMLVAWLVYAIAPTHFSRPSMNALSYCGAMVVVLGAMISAIGDKLPFFQTRHKEAK